MLPRKWNRRWKIHERTQRDISRFVFLLAAALPTIMMMGWIGLNRIPWYQSSVKHAWESRLSSDTLMNVSIGSVSNPKPRQYVLKDISVQHPETKREVVRIQRADAKIIQKRADANQISQGWVIKLIHPELELSELSNCLKLIHDRFLCSPQLSQNALIVEMNDLVVRSENDSLKLVSEIQLLASPDRMDINLNIRQESDAPGTEAKVQLVRQHTRDLSNQAEELTTIIKLNSNQMKVPCSLIPSLPEFGPQATFEGQMVWTSREGAARPNRIWRIDSGSFENADWKRLSKSLPFLLTGHGTLTGINATFEDDQLVQANGRLVGKDGLISRSLIASAKYYLDTGIQDRGIIQNPEGSLRYLEWAIDFGIDEKGLKLFSAYKSKGPTTPRTILYDSNHADILLEPKVRPNSIPIHDVADWLSAVPPNPSSSQQVVSQVSTQNMQGRSRLTWMPQPGISFQGDRSIRR